MCAQWVFCLDCNSVQRTTCRRLYKNFLCLYGWEAGTEITTLKLKPLWSQSPLKSFKRKKNKTTQKNKIKLWYNVNVAMNGYIHRNNTCIYACGHAHTHTQTQTQPFSIWKKSKGSHDLSSFSTLSSIILHLTLTFFHCEAMAMRTDNLSPCIH